MGACEVCVCFFFFFLFIFFRVVLCCIGCCVRIDGCAYVVVCVFGLVAVRVFLVLSLCV